MEEVRFMSVPSPMRLRKVHPVKPHGQLKGWDPGPWAMVTTIRQYRWVPDHPENDDEELINVQFVDIFGKVFGPVEYFEGPIAYYTADEDQLGTFQLQYQGPDGWTDVFNADETLKFITA